mgnify:CR=1 FL=1
MYNKNDIYYLDASTIHTSVSLYDETITLIKQQPFTRSFNELYSKELIDETEHKTIIDMDKLNDIITKTIECLV